MANAAIPNLNFNGIFGIQGFQHRSGWSKRQGTEIKSLHRELIVDINDPDANHIVVEAEFVAQSTNQGIYNVKLVARQNDGLLLSCRCSCPIGSSGDCKHCCRLLQEALTRNIPANPEYIRRFRKRRRQRELIAQGISCHVAVVCKSENDSGSDWNHAPYVKDNYDQKILGIFFSRREANKRAKKHAQELGMASDDEDEDEEEDEDDQDQELFTWSNDDDGDNYEDWCYKVWVEERAIEDASAQFHK